MTHEYVAKVLVRAIIESPGDRHEVAFSEAMPEPTLSQVSSCCRCLPLSPGVHYIISVTRTCRVTSKNGFCHDHTDLLLTGDYTTEPER